MFIIFVPMMTSKQLNKLRSDIAIIGTGAKRDLAIELEVNPSTITKYLKYGDIPEGQLEKIKEFIKSKL